MNNISTLIKNKIGETNITGYGSKITIVDYIDAKNVIVKFEGSGYLKRTNSSSFKKGAVKSPYCKSVCHKGYIGEGKYKIKVNGINTKQYIAWHSMLERCYSAKFQKRRPTYKECTVCEEWLNFQNFAEWYDKNHYEVNNEKKCLDKDIMKKGNKIYCPEFCVYVPERINLLFLKKNANRGKLPIGVIKERERYSAQCVIDSKVEHLGYFNSPEEAFYAYKINKESYIKQVADEYRDIIPDRLYDTLYKYEVDITD